MIRPCGIFDTSYIQDMAILRTPLQKALALAGILLLFSFPAFASSHVIVILNMIGITLIAVQGLNILTGYTGQISLGQAAFMAVGAYTSTLLVIKGFPFLLALPCAALSAGVVGLIFGLPSLRIKGFYLAMATLAAQFIIPWFFRNVRPDIFGGPDGLVVPSIEILGFAFKSHRSLYFIIMALACLMSLFTKNLTRTRVGRAFIAIRDNDLAAEVLGINLFTYKLRAFFISALYAGVAGCLWAHYARAIRPDHFELTKSVWYLGMVVVGGMGHSLGPIFGTTFIRLLRELTTIAAPQIGRLFPFLEANVQAALGPIMFGLVLMLFLIFEPRGLAHRWETFKATYRLWPFSY